MKRLLCFLSVFSISLFLLSLFHISAYALSDGSYLSADVARSYFGDEIQAKYWTSNGYVNVTYRYDGTCRFYGSANGNYIPSGFDDTYITNTTFLRYSANLTGLLSDPTQIVIDIEPQYRLTDTYQIHSAIGLKGSSYNISAYTSASWDWYFSGSNIHFEQLNDGTHSSQFKDRSFYDYYNMVFADMDSQSSTSGYSLRASFPVGSTASYLVIGCPYVSIGTSGGSGLSGLIIDSSSGSGSQVDMTQTNGILSAIQSGINGLAQAILDGLAYLFVPREGYFDGLINQLRARFSWYTSIENAFNALYTSFSNTNFDSPPNLTVHGDGRTFFGTSIGTFDASAFVLDWFTSHRATARAVQSSFMWLFFLLRTYKHLPSILAGNSTGDGDGGDDE